MKRMGGNKIKKKIKNEITNELKKEVRKKKNKKELKIEKEEIKKKYQWLQERNERINGKGTKWRNEKDNEWSEKLNELLDKKR